MIDRLVAAIGRLRWPVVGLWVVLLAVAGVVGAPLPTLLSGGGWNVPGSESDTVNLALQHGFVARGDSNITVVVHAEAEDLERRGAVGPDELLAHLAGS